MSRACLSGRLPSSRMDAIFQRRTAYLANQRREGWHRLVDVRPLVIADAQVTELISQAKVRSTTQRHRPSPLPCLVRRIATNGSICRARSPRRMAAAS